MAVIVDVEVNADQPGVDRDELESFLVRVCSEALRAEGWQDAEVSVVVTGDEEIRTLNREYRGIDAPTDVLSFPLEEWEEGPAGPPAAGAGAGANEGPPELPLGDVVISIERARQQAEEYGHSFWRELGFLAVHGVLHLLGYDHQSERERKVMREREEAILGELGLGV